MDVERGRMIFEAWDKYLDSLSQDELIGPKLAEHVRWWWETLNISNCFPVPCAGLTADEERFQFAWSYPHLLLEVEVGRNGDVEWFARDRVSGEAEDGILTQGAGPTVEFTRWSLLLPLPPLPDELGRILARKGIRNDFS